MIEYEKQYDIENELKALGCVIVRSGISWSKQRNKGMIDFVGYTIRKDGRLRAEVLVVVKQRMLPIHTLIPPMAEAAEELGAKYVLFILEGQSHWFNAKTFIPLQEPPAFENEAAYLQNEDDLRQALFEMFNQLRGYISLSQYLPILCSVLLVRFFLHERDRMIEWEELSNEKFAQVVKEAEDAFGLNFGGSMDTLPNLTSILKYLDGFPPSGVELSKAFLKLISQLSRERGGDDGQFITSPHIATFFRNVIEGMEQSNAKALDMGSGFGFIIQAVHETCRYETIIGLELSRSASSVCRLAFLLEGKSTEQIKVLEADAISWLPPKGHASNFDLVTIDPPLGYNYSAPLTEEYEVTKHGKAKASDLMIEKALRLTKSGGYVLAIVPENTLFGSGSSKRLRDLILEKAIVEAIIKMPDHILKPYTAARVSILIIRLKKVVEETAEHVFIASPEQVEHLEQTVTSFLKWRAEGGNL
ncbi:class I SAM-dependent DNA methyltransferase [Paenibacillus sp. NPDC058071]|uniref:HsdM family class I SAM-dependent methyltransferase n=1 Tax=Paenibacillus sp. NPDC058071 TaxID=3346326 RepID=UPI0036DCA0A7